MPSEQYKKTAEKAVQRGGKPPKGVKRVAALPMGASGIAARLLSPRSIRAGGLR